MASYHSLLQHTNNRFESPAKVFAKLKSKVQQEAVSRKVNTFTARDPLCNVRDKHVADFNSPRRRKDSGWMSDEHKENQRFGSYRNEAEALTLSPISSPQKTLSYPYSDISCKPVEEISHVTDIGRALQSRNQQRAFLESTAMFPPLTNGFTVTSRPPVKKLPVEQSCRGWMSQEERALLDELSPGNMFSPIKNSLRKRKLGQQEIHKVSSSTKVCNEVTRQPKERKSSAAVSEDDVGTVRGSFPAERSEMNQLTSESMFEHRSIAEKWCCISLERLPLMSPAKMFAFMKERENNQEQQEVHKVSSSTSDVGHYGQSRDMLLSTADNTGEMEDATIRGVPESVSPVNRSRLESADSQSDTEPSDIPPPAVPSQPVLLEDPLVLNSPRISIPKKDKAVFKHNKWSQNIAFPSESVIYLTNWFLRRNRKGLFVDGFCKEGNIPWNSNIIVERVSNSVLKTVSGRVYILVGKMKLVAKSEFPKWFLKEFTKGFPPNWKELYEKFLSESRERSIMAKTTSKGCNRTVKRHRQKPLEMPDSCFPASSCPSSTKVSRSGRVIKPLLEYWKGGRVILDSDMNVTIYECYDTSLCKSEVGTQMCTSSQEPARVLCSEGHKQYGSTSDSEPSVHLRKVKAPLRKRNPAKVNPVEKPSSRAEPPVETLSHHISSPEEWSGNIRRCLATKRTHMNTVPPSQSKPEKPSTQKSKKQTHNTNRPSVRGSRSRQTVAPPTESPVFHNKVSQCLETSSDDEFTDKRKKRDKGAHTKRGGKFVNKSQSNCMSPSSQSSEESKMELKKMARVTRQKRSKTLPPIKQSNCMSPLSQSSEESRMELRKMARVTRQKRSKTSPPIKQSNCMSPLSQSSEESRKELRKMARVTRQKQSKTLPPIKQSNRMSPLSQSSEESRKELRKMARVTRQKQSKTSPPIKQSNRMSPLSQSSEESRKELRKMARVTRQKQSKTSPPIKQSNRMSPLSQSSEESRKELRKMARVTRQKQSKTSPPIKQSNRMSPLSQSSEESRKELRKMARVTRQKQSKTSPPIKPLPKLTQSSKIHKGHKVIPQEQDEDKWTEAELIKLQQAVSCYPKHKAGYWAKVAMMVGTRSAEECHNQHTSQGNSQTPAKKTKKAKKTKNVEAPKESAPDFPVISARVGTFKRKQQVRQFLEAMPRDDVEDVFSTAYMQNKRFEIPSMCMSEDVTFSDLEPMTPMSTCLHEAKTPECLHITPGMMGSPSRNIGDKYVYQLQKRMKKNQFNVYKQASSSKSFTPTPTVKRKMKRCGNTENDTFVVWEMFPDQEPESGEEEDFYFSDND